MTYKNKKINSSDKNKYTTELDILNSTKNQILDFSNTLKFEEKSDLTPLDIDNFCHSIVDGSWIKDLINFSPIKKLKESERENPENQQSEFIRKQLEDANSYFAILDQKEPQIEELRFAAWQAIRAAFLIGSYHSATEDIKSWVMSERAAIARKEKAKNDDPKIANLDNVIKQAASELNRALSNGETFARLIRPKVLDLLNSSETTSRKSGWPSVGTIKGRIAKMTSLRKIKRQTKP